MFYVLGTPISTSDARYLLSALASIRTQGATDAAAAITLGMAGQRDVVPLTPPMRDAVYVALADDSPDALIELRARAKRKKVVIKEW